MLTGGAATFTSPGIDTGAGETYSISADGVRLASEPGILAPSTLTINLTYASDATFTTAGLSAADIVNIRCSRAERAEARWQDRARISAGRRVASWAASRSDGS